MTRRKLAWFVLGAAAFAVLVYVVAAILTAATNSTETNERGESREPQTVENDETLAIIKDCTDPAGDCYKRGQAQTAAVVGQIGAGNILAVVCALQVPNGTPLDDALDQVTTCVATKLAETRSTP